jgi:hypothetical protein
MIEDLIMALQSSFECHRDWVYIYLLDSRVYQLRK